MKHFLCILGLSILMMNCQEKKVETLTVKPEAPFVWEAANVYFLLTDRFNNGDPSNDVNFGRNNITGFLRGFEGGDLRGVIQKIEEGYFTDLGINAIWMTPIVEQIHGSNNEGTGTTYAFHGYWTKDWSALDPNFGTKEDLHELVKVAHEHGIRILLDAVINHTGPVTNMDPVWPDTWVRTNPQCSYKDYGTTVECTLVANLPDIRTESNDNVELPPQLVEKWKAEGRYEEEVAELDAFFERTGHPRAPRFYIMKWLTDYITEFGIDGYRVDTVKHTEPYVWQEFKKECDYAFAQWRMNHPEKVLDDNEFYLIGEVYNYGISGGKYFDFGDQKVNYFDHAFNSLINFEAKWNAKQMDYESMFKKYSDSLNSVLKGYSILNYMSSHDDAQPFDPKREKPFETANRLLLCPGASQVYYGDELARPLVIEGTMGDATLRSFMNWEDLQSNPKAATILAHWQKLGQFRRNHPAVGAGTHQMLSKEPYVFARTYSKDGLNDEVVVGIYLNKGPKELNVSNIFAEGETLYDFYSNQEVTVVSGKVTVDSNFDTVLLERL
ncbi:alpha-amylase family glycosyl hydrolase [Mangrovimonas sp. DI 80]|uniref:alpha-amylase family glycosyl hydrolase n=1 Tax=Mangrovimonas sp. DI 80 TaxID=1779330 RepID=UPI0009770F35|nr:alpha-amylase family glycosyl hydrolase [Mangrovimonas sp. DI 80]OMP31881.1 alpha-amlyase [Mangrovimonas sp. DI 80]